MDVFDPRHLDRVQDVVEVGVEVVGLLGGQDGRIWQTPTTPPRSARARRFSSVVFAGARERPDAVWETITGALEAAMASAMVLMLAWERSSEHAARVHAVDELTAEGGQAPFLPATRAGVVAGVR